MEQSAGLHTDPSLAPFPSISSSSMGNTLEQEHTVPGNLLGSKSALNEEVGGSRSLQSNWQVLTVNACYIFDKILLLASIKSQFSGYR